MIDSSKITSFIDFLDSHNSPTRAFDGSFYLKREKENSSYLVRFVSLRRGIPIRLKVTRHDNPQNEGFQLKFDSPLRSFLVVISIIISLGAVICYIFINTDILSLTPICFAAVAFLVIYLAFKGECSYIESVIERSFVNINRSR